MGVVHPGKRNPNWKGGRTIASNGYVLLRIPGHPLADVRGYVYEHRMVAMNKIGRMLKKGEVVHHLNGNKQDNREGNIEVLESISKHMRTHHPNTHNRKPGEPNILVACFCGCGARIRKFDRWGRPRVFVSGHNLY